MGELDFARNAIESAFPDATEIILTRLNGGVSSDCVSATWFGGEAVVKRALPRLKVADLWQANPDRILAEADALNLFKELTPSCVPSVLARYDQEQVIVIELASPDKRDWREVLLRGECDPKVGQKLGETLSIWHRETRGKPLPERLENGKTRLYELRVAPFHLDLSTRWLDQQVILRSLADELMEATECAVHGDFSPKNVLHGPSGTWVLDAEVAHRGAPVLDLAFLAAHLLIKAIHLPGQRHAIHQILRAFLGAYTAKLPNLPRRLGKHTGAIIGVRIDGKSRVHYLNDDSRDILRSIALDLLNGLKIEEMLS